MTVAELAKMPPEAVVHYVHDGEEYAVGEVAALRGEPTVYNNFYDGPARFVTLR